MLDEARSTETVGEKTYRRIRADIVFGRLPPGERLTLDRMRDAYEVSVSTLREMLNRLSSEGLVVAEGSRGFQVTPISAANLREVAAMRCLLETHAQIYDRYLRYEILARLYTDDGAANEHRKLMDCALNRDWKTAQTTLTRHVRVWDLTPE